jgi:hypothetical protein
MVDQRSRFGSQDPDFESYGEDITGRGARSGARPYAFGRSARQDYGDEESSPLFLSDSEDSEEYADDGDLEQWDSAGLLRKNKSSVSLKILMGVLAASAVAMLFALFTSDAMRDAIDSAKASFASVLPVPSAAAQPDSTQLTVRDIQLKDPTRLGSPSRSNPQPQIAQSQNTQAPSPQTQMAMVSPPSREEITNAYQSALQRAPTPAAPPQAALPPAAPTVMTAPPPQAAAPSAGAPMSPPVSGPSVFPSPVASPAARHIEPEELAMLMRRARALLESGDISPARLLLERAADAQDPSAAFLLAQTYDPEVLGTRTITPDPAAARAWYQKAAQYGSADAQRRLAQMQN